eukprot:CAMPEP_0198553808 /NCGR_PEP_ID=MMETSP1462-20131121/81234_1 /TAXON_ID=1333877 /ORGANISM="Brandtodinium nutriculum, Strain RCC3387" /LENGTH=47 /DNA_ID= /DNA_START= /DNA_END= /DNA_ORIENTATION=
MPFLSVSRASGKSFEWVTARCFFFDGSTFTVEPAGGSNWERPSFSLM